MRLKKDCFLDEFERRFEQLPADEREDARAWLYDIAGRCGLTEETIDDLKPSARANLDALLAATQPFQERCRRLMGRYLVVCASSGPALLVAVVLLMWLSLTGVVPIGPLWAIGIPVVGGLCLLVCAFVVTEAARRSYGRELRDMLDGDPILQHSLQLADQFFPDDARFIRDLTRLPR